MVGFFEDGYLCLDCGDLIFANDIYPDVCECKGVAWMRYELQEGEEWNKEV